MPMESRVTMDFSKRLSSMDGDDGITAEEIFEMIDTDGDGNINIDEYKRMHRAITDLVRKEHQAISDHGQRAAKAEASNMRSHEKMIRAKRRNRLLWFVVSTLGVFLLASTALNTISQFYISELQKQMLVSDDGELIKKGSNVPVITAPDDVTVDLTGIAFLDEYQLQTLRSITLELDDGTSDVYRVTGYRKETSVMRIFTARGDEIEVAHGSGEISIVEGGTSGPGRQLANKLTLKKKKNKNKCKEDQGDDCRPFTATTGMTRKEYKKMSKLHTTIQNLDPELRAALLDTWCVSETMDDPANDNNKLVTATTMSRFQILSHWQSDGDTGADYQARRQQVDDDGGRRLQAVSIATTAQANLIYYKQNAHLVFPAPPYTGMCYDTDFLQAQFNWCASQNYVMGDFADATACVEDYVSQLAVNSLPVDPLDPTATWFAACTAEANGDRRRRLANEGASCHPAHATVERVDGARVRMDELKVGEKIRTPSGFEPVVGFLHADKDLAPSYYVFDAAEAGVSMAISANHFVYADGAEVDPSSVKIGQVLTTPEGPATITAIKQETHLGAYHLVTASGAYYVDSVLASTYVSYIPHWAWKVFGDGYITARYHLGIPLVPDGDSPVPLFWMLDVLNALHVPSTVQASLFWPTIVVSAVLTEVGGAIAKTVAATAHPALLLPGLATLTAVAAGGKSRAAARRACA